MPLPIDRWPTGRMLSAAARRVERDWDAHLAGWDLTHAGLPVLDLLTRGDRSQRELAGAMGVTEQTMSRIVTRLERTGYVTRQVHATDRRRHVVVLTAAGRDALREAGDPAVAEALTGDRLPHADVVELRRILTALLTADEADGAPPADDVAPPGRAHPPGSAPEGEPAELPG